MSDQKQFITAIKPDNITEIGEHMKVFYELDDKGVFVFFNTDDQAVMLGIEKGDRRMEVVFTEISDWLTKKADDLRAIPQPDPKIKKRTTRKVDIVSDNRLLGVNMADTIYTINVETNKNDYHCITINALSGHYRIRAHNFTESIEEAIAALTNFAAFANKISLLINNGNDE